MRALRHLRLPLRYAWLFWTVYCLLLAWYVCTQLEVVFNRLGGRPGVVEVVKAPLGSLADVRLQTQLSHRLSILLTPSVDEKRKFWLSGARNVTVHYRWEHAAVVKGYVQSLMHLSLGVESVQVTVDVGSPLLPPFAVTIRPSCVDMVIQFHHSPYAGVDHFFVLKELEISRWHGLSLQPLDGTRWRPLQWFFFRIAELVANNSLLKWSLERLLSRRISELLANPSLREVGTRMICHSDCP